MSIIIFGDLFTFPEGAAATNRVHTYAKGFQENGINAYVVCFEDSYLEEYNGIIDGVNYYHPFGQKKRNKYFIVRRWLKIRKYYNAITLIKRLNKQDKAIALISYTYLHLTQWLAWSLAKVFRTKLIIEASEYPLRLFKNGIFKRKQGIIKFYIESFLCDGVFCISRFLIDFYKRKGVNSSKLFLVPSTVDPTRFFKTVEKPLPHRYVGYFGNLSFKRDNVDLLIESFAKISPKYSDVHLVLSGPCRPFEEKQITELISQLKIDTKVKYLGYRKREEIIKYITHADILVMVRSNDIESKASYPSKLTEFLATSQPVITVNVGEISDYLTNGVDAFLVEPADVNSLTEKLDFVLGNYEFAKEVGLKGKELTNTIFNYNYQAKRMLAFIHSITN